MNNMDTEKLRQLFKAFNRFMILIWRLGLGTWGNGTKWGGSIMVIKHSGRRSRKIYLTPVNYAIVDGDIYCTAGFGSKSDWYKNVMVNPKVEIWLPDSRWAGMAEDVTDFPERAVCFRQVLIRSGFSASLFGVNPTQLSDGELDKLLENYKLIRIRRDSALTGAGGPGDLAWVWPLTTFVLLGVLLRDWKKKCKPK